MPTPPTPPTLQHLLLRAGDLVHRLCSCPCLLVRGSLTLAPPPPSPTPRLVPEASWASQRPARYVCMCHVRALFRSAKHLSSPPAHACSTSPVPHFIRQTSHSSHAASAAATPSLERFSGIAGERVFLSFFSPEEASSRLRRRHSFSPPALQEPEMPFAFSDKLAHRGQAPARPQSMPVAAGRFLPLS